MGESLMGRVALITGATGGLGRAVTRALAEDGAHVYATFQRAEEREALERLVPAGKPTVHFERTDVTSAEAVGQLVDRIRSAHGRIDILAHLVGGYLGGTEVQEIALDQWERQIALNLTSAFICARAVLPSMREQRDGRIVAVSSRSADRISTGVAAYTASKAGLQALIAAIAEENVHHGITANTIQPSIIDTPANRAAMPTAKHERWPKPEQIAEVIRFLVGPQSALISGASIPVFGEA